jgi:4-diphosphocytidyl-2-C-methyl-D-erythritol kinase
MKRAPAHAKINLALLVGPRRDDGYHEIATVIQRVELADGIELEPADQIRVTGFPDDTLVTRALEELARAEGNGRGWSVNIEKRVPVASGLGGGSSDAATALALANDTLTPRELHELAAGLGSDVPFFLARGPQLATGRGTDLDPLELPGDYAIVLLLPFDARKESTASVYARVAPGDGFAERRAKLVEQLTQTESSLELGLLPPNELVSSPLAAELARLGAFRADVSGAGPAVYGLFRDRAEAEAAAAALERQGRIFVTAPAW